MALEKFPLIYMNNTYTMHNLIRLFEIVISDIATSTIDLELKTVKTVLDILRPGHLLLIFSFFCFKFLENS